MTLLFKVRFNMNQKQKNSLLVAGIIAGVISLPMTWMSIRGASIEGPMGSLFNQALQGVSLDVTGLNGSVTLLVKTPIWFLVLMGVAASGLQLMRSSAMFEIPPAVAWGASILSCGGIALAILITLFSSQASLGIGALVGLVGAAVPLACLTTPTADDPSSIGTVET